MQVFAIANRFALQWAIRMSIDDSSRDSKITIRLATGSTRSRSGSKRVKMATSAVRGIVCCRPCERRE